MVLRYIYANAVELGLVDDLPDEIFEPCNIIKRNFFRSIVADSSRTSIKTSKSSTFSRILKPMEIEVLDDFDVMDSGSPSISLSCSNNSYQHNFDNSPILTPTSFGPLPSLNPVHTTFSYECIPL